MHLFWNWTDKQFIGKPVGKRRIIGPKIPIAFRQNAGFPNPARAKFRPVLRDGTILVDLAPKAVKDGLFLEEGTSGCMAVDITNRLALDPPMLRAILGCNFGTLAATALTEAKGNARIRLHDYLLSSCAVPQAGDTALGLLVDWIIAE